MNWKRDFSSKFFDGILPVFVLYLLWQTTLLPVGILYHRFGGPGLMVYALALIAISAYSFQRGLSTRIAETTRGWYGMASGLLAWAATEYTSLITRSSLSNLDTAIPLLLAILVTVLLWQQYLPAGARFFLATYLSNGAGHILIAFFRLLADTSPAASLFYFLMGYAAIAMALGGLGWIVFFSERRLQRLWAALVVLMAGSAAVYIFWGGWFN